MGISNLVQVSFPENQYHMVETKKNQIVLHHTVSGLGVNGDITYWLQSADRIATHIIIGHDGKKYQTYSSKYWGSHLGIKAQTLKELGFSDYSTRNKLLDESSIGVEIDSWGALIEEAGSWYPIKYDNINKKIGPNKNVEPIKNVEYYSNGFGDFYGYKIFGYEKYTNEQINSLKELILYWCDKYGIDKTYNTDMWDVDINAISGKSGVWTHRSYRADKTDCHPQKELVDMLKSL